MGWNQIKLDDIFQDGTIWFNYACVTGISGRFDAHVRILNIGTKPLLVVGWLVDRQKMQSHLSLAKTDCPTYPLDLLHLALAFACSLLQKRKETGQMEQNLAFRVCESSYHGFSHTSYDTKRDVGSVFHQPPPEQFAKKERNWPAAALGSNPQNHLGIVSQQAELCPESANALTLCFCD